MRIATLLAALAAVATIITPTDADAQHRHRPGAHRADDQHYHLHRRPSHRHHYERRDRRYDPPPRYHYYQRPCRIMIDGICVRR